MKSRPQFSLRMLLFVIVFVMVFVMVMVCLGAAATQNEPSFARRSEIQGGLAG